MKAVLVLMLPAIVLLIIAPQGDATISLEITDNLGNYTPAHKLDGNIDIIFDDFVPQTARIFALVNGKEISSLSLKDYVKPPSSYNFLKQTLYYNITAV
ncbi:MAG: hypothetical protein ISS93_01680, partial [Candidatus Aenigmarchaeota archaeon]|nr:hypothetical protein [Candidatus Aenigmarchaeota archaeon]